MRKIGALIFPGFELLDLFTWHKDKDTNPFANLHGTI